MSYGYPPKPGPHFLLSLYWSGNARAAYDARRTLYFRSYQPVMPVSSMYVNPLR